MAADSYNTEIKRQMAMNLDAGILSVFSLIMDAIISHTEAVTPRLILLIITLFTPFVYSIGLHYKYGQTLGKVAMSLLVIDEGEERGLSLRQAVLRDSVYLLFAVGTVIYILATSVPENFIKFFSEMAWMPLIGFVVAEMVSVAASTKSRSIRDYLAGSVVINI